MRKYIYFAQVKHRERHTSYVSTIFKTRKGIKKKLKKIEERETIKLKSETNSTETGGGGGRGIMLIQSVSWSGYVR
jgi:hypothetical protein